MKKKPNPFMKKGSQDKEVDDQKQGKKPGKGKNPFAKVGK